MSNNISYLLSCCNNQSPNNWVVLRNSNGNFSGRKVGVLLVGTVCELAVCIVMFAKVFFIFSRVNTEIFEPFSALSCISLCTGALLLSKYTFNNLKKQSPTLPPGFGISPDFSAIERPHPLRLKAWESEIDEKFLQNEKIFDLLRPMMAESCARLVRNYLGTTFIETIKNKIFSIDNNDYNEVERIQRDGILKKTIENLRDYREPLQEIGLIIGLFDETLMREQFARMYAFYSKDISIEIKIIGIYLLLEALDNRIAFLDDGFAFLEGYLKDIFENDLEELDVFLNKTTQKKTKEKLYTQDWDSDDAIEALIKILKSFFTIIVLQRPSLSYRAREKHIRNDIRDPILELCDLFLDSLGTQRTAVSLRNTFQAILYVRDSQILDQIPTQSWLKQHLGKGNEEREKMVEELFLSIDDF